MVTVVVGNQPRRDEPNKAKSILEPFTVLVFASTTVRDSCVRVGWRRRKRSSSGLGLLSVVVRLSLSQSHFEGVA